MNLPSIMIIFFTINLYAEETKKNTLLMNPNNFYMESSHLSNSNKNFQYNYKQISKEDQLKYLQHSLFQNALFNPEMKDHRKLLEIRNKYLTEFNSDSSIEEKLSLVSKAVIEKQEYEHTRIEEQQKQNPFINNGYGFNMSNYGYGFNPVGFGMRGMFPDQSNGFICVPHPEDSTLCDGNNSTYKKMGNTDISGREDGKGFQMGEPLFKTNDKGQLVPRKPSSSYKF